ncbi:MAG TPA: DUF1634 domain-containing protein [Candidatus Saccharimonadales bacterium]|nr:DUF1634 domain-containing protein [Candidatus Saccharimonadales bacterium]
MKSPVFSRNDLRMNDQRMEVIIGHLLRAGVLLSAAVVMLGGIIYLVHHGHAVADYRTFQGELSPLRTITGILHGALRLSGRAVIQFGLLLLIATPIARVIFSAVAFARERDFLYVGFTIVVLVVLAYSLFGASPH